MKKLFYIALTLLFTFPGLQLSAQQGIVKCYAPEQDEQLRQKYGLGSIEDFEKWLAPKVLEQQRKSPAERAVVTLPVVFHVIHDNDPVGSGDNLAATYLNAQLEQLNNDFRKITGTSGANNNPVGADSEIEFCMAVEDPQGNTMAEHGINRIDRNAQGWSAPPYGKCRGFQINLDYIENTIKPQSQWDPNDYVNIWVMDLNCGLLGYAQFPSNSGLSGLNSNGGLASTDGVVVITGSVGSTTNPNPNPVSTRFDEGRTLTHELGHYFGLRHIWGDATCGNDYCNDTPTQQGASSGCPNTTTCDGVRDMVENYMDYSDDNCMNVFTQNQKARMQAVMANSPRRGSLATSTACSGGGTGNNAPTASFTYSASNLDVNFDGSGSSDSDGTISSYSWNFGDGNSASGATANHTYASAGTYTVTLTVTDNDGATDADQQSVSVTSSTGGGTDMYVQSISLSTGGGRNKTGIATVTIVDDNGNPVSGTDVTGTFSGSLSETVTSTTGTNGVATLETTSTKQGGGIDFGFCVDNVTVTGLTYNANLNTVTCAGAGNRLITTGETSLRQYPNPVTKNEAVFEFALSQTSEVMISIVNIKGQVVRKFQRELEQGSQKISMELDLSSGMYFYVVKTDEFIRNGKLIIQNNN